MKGGVSFNPVFHTSSLPSNTYYELNKYEPDLQRSPELVDARLLPTMKGGKKTRKSRTHKKHGGSDTTPETEPSTVTKFYRATHQLVRGKKSAGQICEDVRDNYIRIDGRRLIEYYSELKEEERKNSFFNQTNFYAHTFHVGCNLQELGKLKDENPFKVETLQKEVPVYRSVQLYDRTYIKQKIEYIKFTEVPDGYPTYSFPNNNEYDTPYLGYGKSDDLRNLTGYKQSSIFYIKKEDFDEEKLDPEDKKVFNKLKVKEEEDPYLKLAEFKNSPNYYYETWLVRYQLYGFVPTIREYNENQVNEFKNYD